MKSPKQTLANGAVHDCDAPSFRPFGNSISVLIAVVPHWLEPAYDEASYLLYQRRKRIE